MIEIIRTYVFRCDWRPGCLMKYTAIEAEKLLDAKARARRSGWTFTRIAKGEHLGRELARCPIHAFLYVDKQIGRPRRKTA